MSVGFVQENDTRASPRNEGAKFQYLVQTRPGRDDVQFAVMLSVGRPNF